MKRIITTVALAIALFAGINVSTASADTPWYGQQSKLQAIGPGFVFAGLVGLGAYLIANKDAPAGSLKAAVPMDQDAYRAFALAPRGGASGPQFAYGFVSAPEVASAAR